MSTQEDTSDKTSPQPYLTAEGLHVIVTDRPDNTFAEVTSPTLPGRPPRLIPASRLLRPLTEEEMAADTIAA